MIVRKYNPVSDYSEWNSFVEKGKNKTFLFDRRFMDYHSDRFFDNSIVFLDDKNNFTAVLPANYSEKDRMVASHDGLSYGGLVVNKDAKLEHIIEYFYYLLKHLHSDGIGTMRIKLIPSIYNYHPTDEAEYVMFLTGAALYRRDIALVIDQKNKISCAGNIRREANKAVQAGAVISETNTMDEFWKEILVPNLQERFGVNPVHSLDEINSLKNSFSSHIRQFNVYIENKIVAGTTLFIDNDVVHCQYISANDTGRRSGALNFLFRHLIDTVFAESRYFDFGIVNEEDGRKLNTGMLFWKESFGGRSVKHDFYLLETASFAKLEKYLK